MRIIASMATLMVVVIVTAASMTRSSAGSLTDSPAYKKAYADCATNTELSDKDRSDACNLVLTMQKADIQALEIAGKTAPIVPLPSIDEACSPENKARSVCPRF